MSLAPPSLRRCAAASVAGLLLAAGAGPAAAQGPIVEPDGTLADPAAPPPPPDPGPPPPPAQPPVIVIGPDGQPVVQPQETGDPGFYYSDGPTMGDQSRGFPTFTGAVPETHVVRRGDTLWDICWFYFNNPWEWPRIWSYNSQISNPHWIYPGDQVRLYPQGTSPAGDVSEVDVGRTGAGDRGPIAIRDTRPERRGWFTLRQLAFVDRENLEFSAQVEGSTDEKLLLSQGDTIYLSYPEGKPPRVGQRYAIYSERRRVDHPSSRKNVGAYVRVMGELEVVSVKKDKRARAIITDSADVIERGMRVGPLERTFRDVQPTPNQTDLQGTIVAQLEADQLIGARQVVFIDKGENDGVRTGNTMFAVRRGDAHPPPGGRVSNRGLDDRRYPARAIGEVLIVQAGKQTSVGLVSLSIMEIEPGDLVIMRRAGSDGAGAGDE
jgi:hypothetical protein